MNHIPNYKNSFRILKGGKISLVVSAFLASTTLTFASPSGGVVTSGSANISQVGKVTDITQSSNKASINWNKFNVASDEIVNFKQPNPSSITLNRVVGNEKSIINGALNANGQVWILNSNGILFGKDAKVNTAGLLATTKELSDTDFQAGNYNFKGNSKESVINLGTIDVVNGGSVILAANEVRNEGTIKAIKGKVHLVGANEYTVNLNGNSLVNLTVNKGVLDALVKNSGTIIADGGEVYLTTNAVNELLKGVVNNTGIIEANSLAGITGHVELFAHGGTANVAGTINAIDGFVETSADKVKIDDSFRVKADKWLIDPNDFTIAASGGDMTGATLSNNLEGANVEIQSVSGTIKKDGNGDINVNDTITWNSDKKLTLNAQNDIFINKEITATNGKLELLYGQKAVAAGNTADYHVNAKVNLKAGQNFITKLGSNGTATNWTVVDALNMNTAMNADKTKNYALGAGVTLSGTNNWTPIGIDFNNKFTGNFDGLGHTISNLHINDGATKNYAGIFGYTDGATIQNIGVVNVDILGNNDTGALVGRFLNGRIKNSYSTGLIYATNEYSTRIGGLIGSTIGSSIQTSYSTTNVNGFVNVGGLVGNLQDGSISNSYAIGKVTGNTILGGLVGYSSGNITNSYAAGDVEGVSGSKDKIGGLVGQQYGGTKTIKNSYATGKVTGDFKVGGLLGEKDSNSPSTIENSFWDKQNSGTTQGVGNDATATGVSGKTTAQMMDISTYTAAGWNTDTWGVLAADATAEGYLLGSYAYLKGVTKSEDIKKDTLFTGGFGTAGNAYTIKNWTQLQNINNSNILTKNYYFSLLNDLGTTTAGYTTQVKDGDVLANDGKGWTPIGQDSSFRGNFDGLGHTISNLTIDRPDDDYVGLFGSVSHWNTSYIENIILKDVDIKGKNNVGGLVGYGYDIHIENASVSGKVVGVNNIGGLVGYMTDASDTVLKSHSSVQVTGANNVGGLVGKLSHSSVKESYATGKVTGTGSSIGGLVGYNDFSVIENSYATGEVSGTTNVGGLIGSLNGWSPITNSFFDKDTTKQTQGVGNDADAEGVFGKTTAEMQNKDTYNNAAGSTWGIETDSSLPSSYLYPVLVTDAEGVTSWKIYGIDGISVVYNLGDILTGYTYNGTSQFATTWTTSNIFGNDYSTWILGTDYNFIYGGNVITGFTNAGTYSDISVNILKNGYITDATSTKGKFVIDQKEVALSTSKVYDGNVNFTSDFTVKVNDIISGDAVTASGALSTTSKNAGTYTSFATNTLALSNANYKIGTTTADITKRALEISGITASNKTYDGTTSATVNSTNAVKAGLVDGDTLTLTTSGVFIDKNAGTSKTVNLTTTYEGADKDNYEVTNQATTTADISKKDITAVTGITAKNKVYDGTTNATLVTTGATFAGMIANDKLNLASSKGTFTDKNVGAGKNVSIKDLALDGIDKDNYNLTSTTASATADITKRALEISGITASNKTYDGTTSATVNSTNAVKAGLVDGDTLTLTTSGVFIDKNAGTSKTVNLTTTYEGADKDNYEVTNQATTTADISKKDITAVTGITAKNKVYDGTTNATLVTTGATFAGMIANDKLNLASSKGTFTDKNVGTGKTVSITDLALSGDDAQNYNLTATTASTTADISKKDITAVTRITAENKTYDGKLDASLVTTNAAFTGMIVNDKLNLASSKGTFTDKNVGTGKTVSITDLALSGDDAQNYNLTSTIASTTADITKRALEISGITASNKTYDGNTNATVNTTNINYAGLVGSENLTVSSTGTFGNKDVGTNKIVNLSNTYAAITGTDLNNYAITDQTTTMADITAVPKPDSKPEEVKKIVDSITNQTSTIVNLPKMEATTTPNNIGKNTNISFSQGENKMIVSKPIEGQATQRVSLSEARQMQIQSGGSSEEVRVPLSNSSIIELVNGGVSLPLGVEQEFYVSNTNTQESK